MHYLWEKYINEYFLSILTFLSYSSKFIVWITDQSNIKFTKRASKALKFFNFHKVKHLNTKPDSLWRKLFYRRASQEPCGSQIQNTEKFKVNLGSIFYLNGSILPHCSTDNLLILSLKCISCNLQSRSIFKTVKI